MLLNEGKHRHTEVYQMKRLPERAMCLKYDVLRVAREIGVAPLLKLWRVSMRSIISGYK